MPQIRLIKSLVQISGMTNVVLCFTVLCESLMIQKICWKRSLLGRMTIFRVSRRSRQSGRTGDGLVHDGNEPLAGGEALAPLEESRDVVCQNELGQVDLKLQNHLEQTLETLRLRDLHAGNRECLQNE